ncbi:MAG TPA: SUMF1/EgtB/PvdO family nonheme iron enzyme [Candidatus Contendobacter sp.]|nr:SUMF1/EgtB/PvdO family nonheme iron enzyme [Candidatus Contendobacter sp.]HRZ23763.1 SUMF1/EgtB/PvdO family nonheme iron enzyme [Candidatus Contendobacter sp.]HRZ51650.1 SUMF1/EgtB/PvdO family nonheme iron enzyme [Candidatus Contendobacter sp.]
MTEETNALPTGYNLHRYQIEGVLGAGGFGITYKAIHEALENEVAIKEYFPAEWAYRDHNGINVRPNAQGQIPARETEPPCYEWGLQRFLDEAKILVQVNHPGVVRVRDYFTANGTAYIVMEYEVGESLSATLQRGGILPEPELRRILNDVIPALEAVHAQGYLHRDIKPSNLYIRASTSRVILLDFGAARQALGRRTRSVTSVVTPGYSPIEQYVTVGEDYGPWTDIYAVGAVLYRCITGTPPIEAPGRVLKDPVQPAVEVGAGLYSQGLLRLVDQAIAVRPEERFQTVAEMREALQATDQANDRPSFSQPPLDASLLDQSATSSLSAARTEGEGQRRPPASRSHPSQRISKEAPAPGVIPSKQQPYGSRQPASAASFTTSPFEDADGGSLPLLENIWEHLDDLAPPPVSGPAKAAPSAEAPPAMPEPAESLLKRSPQSALDHLKKVSTVRHDGMLSIRLATTTSQPSSRATTESPSSISPATFEAPRAKWTPILITVFAVAGLAGASLLAYQYYNAMQEQRQQQAIALQQRQQEEENRRAQETAQNREAEIARYLEQARNAITTKNWKLAATYLERAATLDPAHSALATVRAELAAAEQPTAAAKTRTANAIGLELNWIEGRCFTMGSPASERDRGRDETTHEVCVKSFWMSKTEISNRQFRLFRAAHNSGSFQGRPLNDDTQPAVNLTWDDAKAFAEWLSWESGSGQRFRLPTEAEWEFAARAGAKSRYAWGNDINPRYANFSDRNDPTGASIGNLDDGYAVTAPVGNYQPNALGLFDMAGNVWEWTCSDYGPSYGGDEQRCSTARSNEGQRVVRGGSWNNGAGDLRLAKRLARKPDYRDAMTGFRVVMEETNTIP